MNRRFSSILKTLLARYQTLHLDYPVEMKPRYGYGKPPHALLYSILDKNRNEYKSWLQKALTYTGELVAISGTSSDPKGTGPTWNNGYLPGLDIVMLYTMVAANAPGTYLEIGSGNSTKVAVKAKRDQHLATKIISLDPSPRAAIDMLADVIIRKPLEKADLSVFNSLQKGDILFVDNSHRIFPNSDAMVFFMEVLPALSSGVIVHVHDVFLPFDYPQFMCDRYYSEQYMLASFLLANPEKYHTMMPNFFVSEDPELKQTLNPIWQHPSMPEVERHGGSFWFTVRE